MADDVGIMSGPRRAGIRHRDTTGHHMALISAKASSCAECDWSDPDLSRPDPDPDNFRSFLLECMADGIWHATLDMEHQLPPGDCSRLAAAAWDAIPEEIRDSLTAATPEGAD